MKRNDAKIRYQDAIPEMPASFYHRMETTIEGMEEPMKKRYKVTTVLVAALIAVVVLASVAIAASQSEFLKELFPQGVPEEAEKLFINDALSNEREGVKLTVNEHLYDGRNFHLNWTVESLRDEPVIYMLTYKMRYPDGTPVNISYWSYRRSTMDQGWDTLTALNMPMGGKTTDKKFLGYTSNGFLEGEAPSTPWTYTVEVAAYTTDLTPVALENHRSMYDLSDEELKQFEERKELPFEGEQYTELYRFPAYVAVYDESGVDFSVWHGDAEAQLKALDTCGLLKPLTRLSVTINMNPSAENVKVSRLSERTTLKFKDIELTINQLEFDLAGIHLEYYVPMDQLPDDEYSDHFTLDSQFLIFDQDKTLLNNDSFRLMGGMWMPDDNQWGEGIIPYMTVEQGGGTVSKLPTEITLVRASTKQMRDWLWNSEYDKLLDFLEKNPEMRDEATITLEVKDADYTAK